jgi:anti-sigma factor RsiW
LIIDGSVSGTEERAKMDAHLERCARCSTLYEFWRSVHESAAKLPAPELPSGLSEKVRQAAHAELGSRLGERAARQKAPAGPGVPGFIWAAIGAVTVLTLGFLIPAVREVVENQKLTPGAALALVLILQNTLTLFFAPVVLRRERHLQGGCQ